MVSGMVRQMLHELGLSRLRPTLTARQRGQETHSDETGRPPAATRYRADRIVGEVNNGGDLIESTLRTVDENIAYRSLYASRGKLVRAKPVSALYEQGRVHHFGSFPVLEEQIRSYVPGQYEGSPYRPDPEDGEAG